MAARGPAAPDAWAAARERFAVRDYRGAILLVEESIGEGRAYADAYNLLGLSLAMVGRERDALEAFENALRINPRYVEAQLNRAVLLNDLGREAEAAEALRTAAQLDRVDESGFPALVANRLANSHAALGDDYRDAGALDEAIEQYERALALRPAYADIRLSLARALVERGRLDRAAEAVTAVLEARPGSLDALLLRGLVAYLQDDLAGAEAAWSDAEARQPGEPRVATYRSMLARRRATGE